MSKITVLIGSPRKNGNTEILANSFIDGVDKQENSVEVISVIGNRVTGCIGCDFCYRDSQVKELVLLAVCADTIPTVFDAVITMYNSVLSYFSLRDGGVITIPGMAKKGDIIGNAGLMEARKLGESLNQRRTPAGKYYASVLFEYEVDIEPVKPVKVIGLNFSMHNLFVSSEEDIKVDEEFLRHYRHAKDKLAKEQRRLSHCEKCSNRYDKQKKKVTKIHEKIANQRKDCLHKVSRQIANVYDAVCIEDLDMKAMSQALNFGKSVADNGWGMFTGFLEYKLIEQGKKLIRIDKWYPSSKTCHVCGYINETLLNSKNKTVGHTELARLLQPLVCLTEKHPFLKWLEHVTYSYYPSCWSFKKA